MSDTQHEPGRRDETGKPRSGVGPDPRGAAFSGQGAADDGPARQAAPAGAAPSGAEPVAQGQPGDDTHDDGMRAQAQQHPGGPGKGQPLSRSRPEQRDADIDTPAESDPGPAISLHRASDHGRTDAQTAAPLPRDQGTAADRSGFNPPADGHSHSAGHEGHAHVHGDVPGGAGHGARGAAHRHDDVQAGRGHSHEGHDHAHGDAHKGHGHSHAPEVSGSNERRIFFVLLLTAGYALIQAAGGWLSGSLALVADSGHMLSDAAALALALVAYRVARRAADAAASYGYHRVRVLAALANGAALLLLVAWITWEAVSRLREPVEVMAGPMLVVAVIGLLVNLAGAFILMRGESGDQNLKGALLHVIGDLLGSVGAIGASVGILLTGWTALDPILSVLVAVLVLRSAWGLVKASLHVLLQGTPEGLSSEIICAELVQMPEVAAAGHAHVWTLTDARYVATVHVTPAAGTDPLSLPDLVRGRLTQRFGIEHATVEVNRAGAIPGEPGAGRL